MIHAAFSEKPTISVGSTEAPQGKVKKNGRKRKRERKHERERKKKKMYVSFRPLVSRLPLFFQWPTEN